MSHPRRRQLRCLGGAGVRGLQSAALLAAAALLVDCERTIAAGAVGLIGFVLLASGAGALRDARRSGIGADSEWQVRRALESLRAEGWRVQHGVLWPGGGDIDHIARSPGGVWFAIETKTRRYTRAQLERTAATAHWLGRRQRRRAIAMLCVVRDRRRPRVQHGVVVLSLPDLLAELRELAGACGSRRGGSHVRRRAFVGRAVARW